MHGVRIKEFNPHYRMQWMWHCYMNLVARDGTKLTGLKGVDMSNKNLTIKKVSICLNHKWVDGMAERISKVYPKATHVKIKGVDCVACNNLV